MLTGILHPSAGEVKINGVDPHKHRRRVAQKLGVVFGQRSQLWWDLPVKDSYDILAHMYRVAPAEKERRLAELGELLDLKEFWETPVRKLSLGQRMRADIAASLLHDPDVLFLDEPTIGLDVTAKRSIREFLKTLNGEFGKTILLTTHDMNDIEQLCLSGSWSSITGNSATREPSSICGTKSGSRPSSGSSSAAPTVCLAQEGARMPLQLRLDGAEGEFRIIEASGSEVLIEANRAAGQGDGHFADGRRLGRNCGHSYGGTRFRGYHPPGVLTIFTGRSRMRGRTTSAASCFCFFSQV